MRNPFRPLAKAAQTGVSLISSWIAHSIWTISDRFQALVNDG